MNGCISNFIYFAVIYIKGIVLNRIKKYN
jgi:hypothetical protein